MENIPVELKRKKLETGVKIALGLTAAVVVAPAVYIVAKTVIAASAAVLVGGATAMIIVYRAPVWAHRLALKKIKDIKAQAAANPIEDAEDLYMKNSNRLEESRKMLTDYIAAYNNFCDKARDLSAKYPARQAEFDSGVKKHGEMLEFRKKAFAKAKEDLELLYEKIQEMKAMWEMAQASIEMDKLAGKMNGGDPMEQIRAQASYDSVIKAVNTSFAQLDVALLENNPSPTLQGQTVVTPEVQHVLRKD